MEKIIDLADELNKMIYSSSLYSNYIKEEENLKEDNEAKSLLEKFDSINRHIITREQSGIPVEDFELAQFKEIAEEVRSNQVLLNYLEAQTSFTNLIVEINKVLSGAMKI